LDDVRIGGELPDGATPEPGFPVRLLLPSTVRACNRADIGEFPRLATASWPTG